MKLKDSLNKRLNTRLASLVMLSVLSVPWVASAAGNSVVANNMLPGNGNVIAGTIEGGFKGSWAQGNQMNLHQTTQNAIVTWDSFSIGANATVTIRGDHDNFNMLNYVTGSESSQIYGKLNSYVGDKQGGNIYLVNPNGVQIGNSAEINVGSLHIANKKIDNINTWNENTDIAKALKQNKAMTNAELMSLGYINANKLVFEGERVVIDMDRLSGLDTTQTDALTIVSRPYDGKSGSVGDNRKYDVVLGSSTPKNAQEWGKYIGFADNGTGDRWQGTVQAGNPDAPNQSVTEFFTYRWIKDGKELEKIGQETGWGMGDHYALRYSIDLTGSNQTPIGTTKENAFKGKFDGLDNYIFGLSIKNSKNKYAATSLFGFTNGAIMGNVTLIAGDDGISIQGGNTDTGAFIGHAVNTTVKGVNSTLKVSGTNNVGGIIGYAEADTGRTYNFADAAGSVQPDSRSSELSNLTNTGNVSGVSNVGGLVGYMNGGKLSNDEENRVQYKGSYNLGKITGIDKGSNYSYNIGGMIGKAVNATVGGTKNTLINYNTVEGGYNVGGIVGSISSTTVANASNEGVVKANGFTIDSYIYHTDNSGWKNNYDSALPGTHKAEVRAANVGGIVGSSAGSELKDVTNKADVSSAFVKQTITSGDHPDCFDHYAAGNVGGIVGRAEDSNITNADNVESNIRGAMNVGGIAGYFGSTDVNNANKKDYRILNAINNGGDIMATGGIKKDGSFTKETTHRESYITGNIGGIAGYLYGVPVHIEAGGNRGDVHTAADTSELTSQAVNVGGIVGKIDMPKATGSDGNDLTDRERLDIIKSDTSAAGNSGYANAVVSSSYNTGNVTGYTNIGGIGGFAYNGSIAASYNVGDIHTTRADASGTTPINMGGILGDSTEQASGRVIIYDTYNKGTIGDSSYNTYGRHVGGIVGRLSGIVEKSYNNGDIYNGLNVVGGIAGYWYSGYLKNVFNTGNITVNNKNGAESQVGGIVGSADLGGGNQSSGGNTDMSISNAYNLGSLRSFKDSNGSGANVVGGILGATFRWSEHNTNVNISNAYTMGNIYADSGFAGYTVGGYYHSTNPTISNVYYIRPKASNGYIDLTLNTSNLTVKDNAMVIDYGNLNNHDYWTNFSFSGQTNGTITEATDDNWRMSNGASLPMLNAFLSGSHNYFSQESNWQEFIKDNEGADVQYGTAYDPLLTIINTKKDLIFNWSDMDLKNNGSLAVFGLHDNGTNLNYTPGLTLNNVEITNSTHIFGGTIYSDGLLELNAKDDLQGGLRFGMDSVLYGSDVMLKTNSSLELSGSVISTGNHNALSHFNPDKSLQHGININAADLTVYGKLITKGKEGEKTEVIVPGINYGYGDSQAPDKEIVSDKNKAMTSQGMTHAYQLQTAPATTTTGNITISTMEKTLADGTHMNGSANLLYGNYKKGKIETKGNLTVSSSGDILVDSDLKIGDPKIGDPKIAGRINLIGNGSGSNIILDLSNIGGELQGNEKIKALHAFIDAHTKEETGIYGNNAGTRPMRITFNLWDNIKGDLNFDKNDLKNEDGTTVKIAEKLKNLYVESAGTTYKGNNIRNIIYTWISNAEELNSLQRVAENLNDGRDALSYNYILKNDIDASGLVNAANSTYNTIGRGKKAFTGTFDGDGHTIVGLQAKGGIFGKLGSGAVVKNINIASSVFTGNNIGDSVGAVAAENNGGSISGISGYGNTIKGSGGSIGGLVGKNYGGISNSNDHSTVIAGADTVAGGIAGVNGTKAGIGGTIDNVQSNSAVTTGGLTENQYADNLGGIVGKNELSLNTYNINNVSAHGVTGKTGNTKTSGGIVGTNEGIISNAYNESIIHGSENIGGLLGNNSGTLTAGYNTGVVDAGQSSNVGGIAGTNSGKLDQVFNSVVTVIKTETDATDANGRKLYNYTYTDGGAISGASNVGGIVGSNTGTLSNAYSTTAVEGNSNVANIVGSNAGQVSNIYGYAANRNTNVTNVNGGTVSKSYIIKADGKLAENGQNANKLDSYDFEDKKTTWKLYDKRTNPLLKVFLTKVTVADDMPKGWVYDAINHLDIHGWINSGKLTTVDPKNDAFAAYNNNSSLLQGEALKNVGTYSSWLWSGQIASGGDAGPNNLGYDFTVGDIQIAKKVLNVTGNTVNRTYGSLLKKDDYGLSINYALSINGFDGFNDAMKAELDGKVTITDSQDKIQNSQDEGIITAVNEKRTNNKGAYKWHAGVKLDDSLTGNYEFINDGVSNTTTTVHGVSNVLARKVSLNDINANLTYGSKDAINDHINGVVSIKDLASAIVYGDDVKLADGAVVNVKDGSSYATNKDGRHTADAGTYDNSLKIDNAALTGDANKLGNYELVNDATGSIIVGQAEMHVKLNGVERTYGNTALINGTSYGVNGLTGNVNGDNYGVGDVNMGAVTSDGALTGTSTGKVTNDAGDTYKWNANVVTANDKLKQNYKLVVDGGASVVKQATLQVSLKEVVRTYGNTAITSGGYSASNITGLVNGDSYDASAITVNKTSDGALTGNTEGQVTNDYGNYTWSGDLTTDNAALKNNYKLELKEDGVSKVGKAKLTFVVDDKIITQNVPAEYTGTANGLTNGDTLAGIGVGGYELDSSVNPLIVGVYEDKIGVLINGSLHLTGGDGLLKNYKVEIDPGTLTVLASFNPADDYWFGTAPWDKERNLRERKAEFHYVAGGMSL